MVSADQAVRVRALAGDIVLCSWARHFSLTVNLSTAFTILKSFEYEFLKIFGPRATAVILKILHPFKYPGLRMMSFE